MAGRPWDGNPHRGSGISPPRELPVEVRRAGSRCPLTDTATPATALIVAAIAQLKRSLIAERVESALRRAQVQAHHRTEIAPPCRTITHL